MAFHIYLDESGTHNTRWLFIGALFVPDHGALHSALCKDKEELKYWNTSPKRNARYREVHLTAFRSPTDVAIAKRWIDQFTRHACFYRCIAIDWDMWDSKYFGGTFEPESLKRNRAYKKWVEMLLQPELKTPTLGRPIAGAKLYLDRLRIVQEYNVVEELRQRFTRNYKGEIPYIEKFEYADSWRDAHQCLQMCDLLTGCLYQAVCPAVKSAKRETHAYLEHVLRQYNIECLETKFWRGYAGHSLRKHFPKFNVWFWQPQNDK